MSAARPPASDGVPERDRTDSFALTELWRQALSPIVHGAGCGCCSNPAVVLRADWLEEDVLDYLGARYAAEGERQLEEAIHSRSGGPRGDFLKWLTALEETGVAPADADRLRRDVAGLLSSLAQTGGMTRQKGSPDGFDERTQ